MSATSGANGARGASARPPVSASAIQARGLIKAFGHQAALRGVSLDLAGGEFLALFGPNGAGKTTLIRILASLTRPTSGSVCIEGQDLSKAATAVRRHIGLISHNPLLYGDLTADENLAFFARLYDVPNAQARIDAVLDQVGLAARRRDAVRTYSRGMLQRLTIARGILHDPSIVLLDEPYTGLDLQAADMLGQVLQQLAVANRTVILTTHNLEQGLEMCSRAAILNRGKLVWQARRDAIDLDGMKEIYREVTRTT